MASTIEEHGFRNANAVIDRLAFKRECVHMSYANIANETGLDKATVYRTLKGMITPSLTTVCLIAQSLGCTIDTIENGRG